MGFWLFCQYLVILVLLPSRHAITLVFANSPLSLQPASSCFEHERSALLQFKQSFVIDCTASDDPSAYPKVKSWVGEPNCCLWDGVVCSKESGHVVGLDLSRSCLYGALHWNSTIFTLTHLQRLDLSDNDFNHSPIPSQLGHLSNLRSLDLAGSALTGQIPSETSKLSQLVSLDLSYNKGLRFEYASWKKLLQNLTHLETLSLDAVDISSPVPVMLANLTLLQYVSFQSCNLYGQFPTSIFQLPRLEALDLLGNIHLAGSLPEFRQNSSLTYLGLAVTAFHGELPSSIGNLAGLETLLLFQCHLSGPIPSSLGNLTNLIRLDLSNNDFSGDMPSALTNLTQLQTLGLSNLKVTFKELILWLVKLNQLNHLVLVGMNLGGEIPSFLSNLTDLTYLDLSHNHMTGQIPNWLMNLTHLLFLSLEDNQLNGRIPSEAISQLADVATLSFNDNASLYGNFDAFLTLKNLVDLDLSGVKLTIRPKNVGNEFVPKFQSLYLSSCNLTEFPWFLHDLDELEQLDLSNNNIHGMIPHWFLNVTRESLYMLDLSQNLFTAFEQPVVSLPWSYLEILNLEDNHLQDSLPIPPSSIVIYQVSNNQFVGDIPHQICNASLMEYFDISFNNLSGQIPSCISELGRAPSVLNLKGNNFCGTVPRAFPASCNLKMIDLSENQLHGRLPKSLTNCNNLEVLDVGRNHINDTFPSWLGSLLKLYILILRENDFHGKISSPKASLYFPSLRIIDLSKNCLSGDLPFEYLLNWVSMKVTTERQSTTSGITESLDIITPKGIFLESELYNYSITITNKGNNMIYTKILTVFRVIDFSSNNFTGKIPDVIGQLRGLQALNLSHNNLQGRIPLSLANMTDLESLDLSNNKLCGEIPKGLTQLTSLEVVNVSYNLLVGPIPQGEQFGAFDESSFVGNLGLCGIPLSKKCRNVDESSTPSTTVESNDEEDDSDHLIDWIIRGLGCASGFAAGCALGKYFTDRHHEWFVETFERRRRKPKRKMRLAARISRGRR